MQYLFNAWENLEKRIRAARVIFLCADFDGTIASLKPRPKQARLNKSFRRLLERISKDKSFIIAIISGRALRDIQKKVGLKNLIFAGNHGLEIGYKRKGFIYPRARRYIAQLNRIARQLKEEALPCAGAVLEEKLLSLSLHYRLVKKERMPGLKKAFLRVIKPYLAAGGIKFTHGKKVWEIRPPINWDKGKALLWLEQRLKRKKMLSIFIGDDLTDEDGFRAVNKIGGISILVGKRQHSLARYYLRNIKDTERVLKAIYKRKCRD